MTDSLLVVLSHPQVKEWIRKGLNEKPENFALKFRHSEFPVALIATQLKYLQRSKDKLPSFYHAQAIIPPLAYEQCSSEAAAKSKKIAGKSVLDLTTGLGVDSFYFSKLAEKVVCVEKNADLQAITRYNFDLLGVKNVEFVLDSAENYLQNYKGEKWNWIFIDPARRAGSGEKVFLPEDLQPNIHELLPILAQKTQQLWVKMSPLFDVDAAARMFPNLYKMMVLSVDNECKELNLIWNFEAKNPENISIEIVCIKKGKENLYSFKQKKQPLNLKIEKPLFLYEPDVAFYKSRLTESLFANFFENVPVFCTGSQGFFLSNDLIPEFPGRIFEIRNEAFPYQPKQIVSYLKEKKIQQLNILQRNFPFSTQEIRKSLKIKEGGKDFLICTVMEGKKMGFHCTLHF